MFCLFFLGSGNVEILHITDWKTGTKEDCYKQYIDKLNVCISVFGFNELMELS